MLTPRERKISIVAIVSPDIKTFENSETPSANDPNIIDLWDIDLSPTTETSPESFFPLFNLVASLQISLTMLFSNELNYVNNQ